MSVDAGSILYIESIAGIAGDMFAAACVDAGLISAAELEAVPEKLGFSGVSVKFSKTTRASLHATHLDVKIEPGSWTRFLDAKPKVRELIGPDHAVGSRHDHKHGETDSIRSHPDAGHLPATAVEAILDDSELRPESVAFAKSIFDAIADAEARAHGISRGLVHFHEIGRIDSIVDAAMAGVIIAHLSPARVLASGIKLGRGTVRIAHGEYPIPPPASATLCEGFPIDPVPESIDRENVELSTPTGLAILKVLQPEFVRGWPSGTATAHGYGAGTMKLEGYPNVTRVALLRGTDTHPANASPFIHSEIVEIVCNLDDQTPERSAWMHREVLNHGALDAWVTPVVGKKNRPAQVFSILVEPEHENAMVSWMLRHSTTFGVRTRRWDKVQLDRRIETRETPHGSLRYKIGMTTDGEIIKEKPEFDDLAEIWKKDPNFRPE